MQKPLHQRSYGWKCSSNHGKQYIYIYKYILLYVWIFVFRLYHIKLMFNQKNGVTLITWHPARSNGPCRLWNCSSTCGLQGTSSSNEPAQWGWLIPYSSDEGRIWLANHQIFKSTLSYLWFGLVAIPPLFFIFEVLSQRLYTLSFCNIQSLAPPQPNRHPQPTPHTSCHVIKSQRISDMWHEKRSYWTADATKGYPNKMDGFYWKIPINQWMMNSKGYGQKSSILRVFPYKPSIFLGIPPV